MQRRLVSVATLIGLVAASLAIGAAPAHADGPGVGAPWIVSVGDSAISGEAGRWAGNTNQSSSKVDALGSTAYNDNATNTAEQIPGCHRSKSAEVLHRRRRERFEPRLLRRAHVHADAGVGRLQARARLLQRRERPPGSGPGAAAVRGDAQRQGRHRAHRGQQLRLRRHRADLRDELPHLTHVVEELLLRRLEREGVLHRVGRHDPDHRRAGCAAERAPGDAERRLRRQLVQDPRPDLLVADPPGFGLPVLGVRLHPAVDGRLRHLEPGCGLGQRHAPCRRSTVRCATVRRRPA